GDVLDAAFLVVDHLGRLTRRQADDLPRRVGLHAEDAVRARLVAGGVARALAARPVRLVDARLREGADGGGRARGGDPGRDRPRLRRLEVDLRLALGRRRVLVARIVRIDLRRVRAGTLRVVLLALS